MQFFSAIDRRQDSRPPLVLHVKVITPKGHLKGKTINLSTSGLAILLSEESPEISNEFQVTIKLNKGNEQSAVCKKIWVEPIVADEIRYTKIGARFT